MRILLGTLLSLIAVGVLLIAYGLLSPRASASAPAWNGTPVASVVPVGNVSLGNTYLPTPPQLLLRCEPGQRAAVWQAAGTAEAACVGDSSADRYASFGTPVAYQIPQPRPRPSYERFRTPGRARSTWVERPRGRDWQRTALVIGGTTAAGAGLGAIFGGKKGALIGAALGGGASSIYEAGKR
jgi:hypothetical protein